LTTYKLISINSMNKSKHHTSLSSPRSLSHFPFSSLDFLSVAPAVPVVRSRVSVPNGSSVPSSSSVAPQRPSPSSSSSSLSPNHYLVAASVLPVGRTRAAVRVSSANAFSSSFSSSTSSPSPSSSSFSSSPSCPSFSSPSSSSSCSSLSSLLFPPLSPPLPSVVDNFAYLPVGCQSAANPLF